MNKKGWLFLKVIIWASFLVMAALIFYVNHSLPRGTMFPTGDVICQNDDRGICHESYIEDVRFLNIPEWAKFVKRYGFITLFGLGLVGTIMYTKDKTSDD